MQNVTVELEDELVDLNPVGASPVVSNSSVLIELNQIGRLELLRRLFGQIRIPLAVRRETRRSVDPVDWILETSLQQKISPPILQASLGDGESEAIGLALELRARLVLLDDLPARRLAELLGLPVTGTVGGCSPRNDRAIWARFGIAWMRWSAMTSGFQRAFGTTF